MEFDFVIFMRDLHDALQDHSSALKYEERQMIKSSFPVGLGDEPRLPTLDESIPLGFIHGILEYYSEIVWLKLPPLGPCESLNEE